MKKFLSVILALVLALSCCIFAVAEDSAPDIEALKARFVAGEGPVADGYSIDYMSYSPVGENDSTKYPLVVLLHGMTEGAEPGAQIERSNFPLWASDEMQSRFKGTGGAFLLVARSREEDGLYWANQLIVPLKAAIDDFIAKNSEHIDTSRIYIGGFSMGGKMTLKMAASYPRFFAAAFPMCPAHEFTTVELSTLTQMPIWISASRYDVLAGYYTYTSDIWDKLMAISAVKSDCRISIFGKVCYPDGTPTPSNHHVWFAVLNDMFTSDGGKYYNMETFDGNGNKIDLTYPDGMISWLSSYSTDRSGDKPEPSGVIALSENTILSFKNMLWPMIRCLFRIAASEVKGFFA